MQQQAVPQTTRVREVQRVLAQLWFIVLSTATMVFFSEKAYWYPQGYAIGELILFYAFPVAVCLWAIEYFRVRRLSALVFVAALFAFLVEGVLTPVIYEAGLLDPVMPAYFIGWHGFLSVVFGWYSLRKWLVNGQWRRLVVGSVLFGLFWGMWALTFWLPENAADFAAAGQWPIADFALHALTFTLMLAAGHWLLGRGGWLPQFGMGRTAKWLLVAILLFFFATLAFPAAPLGIIKLAVMLTAVFLPLQLNRRREEGSTILTALSGPVQVRPLLAFLLMPLAATSVYGLATVIEPSTELLQAIFELTPFGQALLGAAVFLWAVGATLRHQGRL